MSRPVSAAATAMASDELESVVIVHDLRNFTCPVTAQIFFDPTMMACCNQYIERSAAAQLKKCPCCKDTFMFFEGVSHFFKATLKKIIVENNLYDRVYFDLKHFKKIVKNNQLNTPIGEQFLTLLQNSKSHLNTKEVIRTETQTTYPPHLEIPEFTVTETPGKSAIEILASTLQGRDLLRKKLRIDEPSGKYFFGHAEILPESLQIQINRKNIREWLISITTAMEKFEKDALERRAAIENEEHVITAQKRSLFDQHTLFLSQHIKDTTAISNQRIPSHAVNPILQKLVYGEESAVEAALEAIKNNPAQLFNILSNTGTARDYSERTISNTTLLQAAAAAGDIEMCLMLKNYMAPKEFAAQISELFPDGIAAHEETQKRKAFNFDAILTAIRAASPSDLHFASNRQNNNNSALCHALEEFRYQFKELSKNEKIFNLYHLLRAFEIYETLWNQCERDGSDLDYKKRDLFWCQIIGYVQRFMPACYAQAFSQGLYYLVKADQPSSWYPETFNRNLKFKRNIYSSYFPLSINTRSGLGFGFAVHPALGSTIRQPRSCPKPSFLQQFLSNKNSWLSEQYAVNLGARAQSRCTL